MDQYDDLSQAQDYAYAKMEDNAIHGGRQSGGGKGRGGKKGGGGGGQGREVQISKALSRLLRHQAENAGIKLDDAGFAPLDKVVGEPSRRTLALASLHTDFDAF